MSAERLINAGATLANIAFNIAQRKPSELTTREAENLIAALDQARKEWDAARSEPEATPAPGAPAGFKLVPIEPTKAMLDSVIEGDGEPVRVSRFGFVDAYKAMFAAHPVVAVPGSLTELREAFRPVDPHAWPWTKEQSKNYPQKAADIINAARRLIATTSTSAASQPPGAATPKESGDA